MTRLRRMMLDELQRRNYSEITTRKNADPSVCSLSVDTLSSNSPLALLQARAALSTISTKPIECAGGLPALDWVPNCHSNPITQRVRRRRQRLPPSLLIENASGVVLASQNIACPRRLRSRLATTRAESAPQRSISILRWRFLPTAER